jgi:hypothetical protein
LINWSNRWQIKEINVLVRVVTAPFNKVVFIAVTTAAIMHLLLLAMQAVNAIIPIVVIEDNATDYEL